MTSNLRTPAMSIGLVPVLLVITVLAACGEGAAASRRMQKAVARRLEGDAHDPCTLLTADEASPYVGALVAPPYRASDGAADVHGDECMYRGRDGREVAVRPAWTGGRFIGGVLRDVPGGLGKLLARGGAPGLDSVAQRVMQHGPAGPWDQATWIPGGSLFASKGEAEVSIDMSGASGQKSDALALAWLIVPRLEHPLHYDGAAAVALAPRPHPHPANACDVIPRAAIEAAIGALDGEPSSDAPEKSCTYRVATAQGERVYPVEFAWERGQKSFTMLKHGLAAVSGVLGLPTTSPLDTLKPPPQMQAAIGGVMKLLAGASGGGGPATAPGAVATIGLRTDTTLRGPWDGAALLHGTQLVAVRHDVLVGLSLQSADYDRAKALLAAICLAL